MSPFLKLPLMPLVTAAFFFRFTQVVEGFLFNRRSEETSRGSLSFILFPIRLSSYLGVLILVFLSPSFDLTS